MMFQGSFTVIKSEGELFLWSLSLLDVNIKSRSLGTHLQAMSISLTVKAVNEA